MVSAEQRSPGSAATAYRLDHRVHEVLPHPASGFREIAQSRADRPTTNKALDPWSPLVAYVGNRGDVSAAAGRWEPAAHDAQSPHPELPSLSLNRSASCSLMP